MSRRRRRHRPKPIRQQCDELLPWLLATCLLDRVTLPLILIVEQADCEKIVDGFLVANEAEIENAITKVEIEAQPHASVTDVTDLLMPHLLGFARQHRDFLDKPLSPYAGGRR